jgi:uracil-DNA glycosylase
MIALAETIPDSWKPVLDPVLDSEEARRLGGWLRAEEDAGKTI